METNKQKAISTQKKEFDTSSTGGRYMLDTIKTKLNNYSDKSFFTTTTILMFVSYLITIYGTNGKGLLFIAFNVLIIAYFCLLAFYFYKKIDEELIQSNDSEENNSEIKEQSKPKPSKKNDEEDYI